MNRLLFLFLALLPLTVNAQSKVYAVTNRTGDLYSIDTTTFTKTSTTLSSTLGPINGCSGLTSDPCGLEYIAYKVNNARRLGTIDFSTGKITDIGLFTDNISNISYDTTTNTLYGVTGDGANTPETLYEIDVNNASLSLVTALGNGARGESIEFNPNDGMVYHWSGTGIGNVIMEKVNPSNGTVTGITLSGTTIEGIGASVYVGKNRFLVSDRNADKLLWVTTSGVVTIAASNSGFTQGLKGLSFPKAPLADVIDLKVIPDDTICDGQTARILCFNKGINYTWYENGVLSSVIDSKLSTTKAGTFICEISENVCNTSDIDSITIVVQNIPTVSLSPSGPFDLCPRDSVTLTGTSGGTSQWYLNGKTVSGASKSTINASAPGVYNMVKININGCSDSAAVGVIVNELPSPTVTLSPIGPFEICRGDSVSISGVGTGTGQWSHNQTLLSGETGEMVYAKLPGVYNLLKTGTNGCSDSSDIGVIITELPLPKTVVLTPTLIEFCRPGTVNVDVISPNGTIQWHKNGVIIPGETSNRLAVTHQGIYNALITETTGCSDSAIVGTEIIDSCGLGINNSSLENELSIYPNPATNKVFVNIPQSKLTNLISISIVSLDGKVMSSKNLEFNSSTQITFDLTGFSSGMYVVQLQSTGSAIFKELVVY